MLAVADILSTSGSSSSSSPSSSSSTRGRGAAAAAVVVAVVFVVAAAAALLVVVVSEPRPCFLQARLSLCHEAHGCRMYRAQYICFYFFFISQCTMSCS